MKTATLNATTETPRKSRYNPGAPGRIQPEGNGRFMIESFRDSDHFYSVDLNEGETGSCSCPDHIFRHRECKHLRIARYEVFKSVKEKARSLAHSALEALLQKYQGSNRPEIEEAIRYSLWEREAGAKLIGEIAAL